MVEKLRRIWSEVELGTQLAPQERGPVFELLKKAVSPASRILEVGAGDGRMIKLLKAEGAQGRFYAVDITQRVSRAPALAVKADARTLPFADNVFDVVYSLGVIEHFAETGLALREHARVTKRGGVVIITTPHIGLQSLLRWLLYFKGREYRKGSFEEVRGRNLSLRYVENLASKGGLSVKMSFTTGPILWWPMWADSLLRRFLLPSRFGSFLFVLATKV